MNEHTSDCLSRALLTFVISLVLVVPVSPSIAQSETSMMEVLSEALAYTL